MVGRELDREPAVLVINQPTWGVDAGAAALIRQVLLDMAENGAAVLVISQDLDEIFEIADRIAVISRGVLSAAYPAREIDRERVGLLMAGAHESAAHGVGAHGTGGQGPTASAAGGHPAPDGGCEAPAADSHASADRSRRSSGGSANGGEAAA